MSTAYAMKVEAHHKLMYANSVTLVTQQRKNPLEGTVMMTPARGEAQSAADLVGAGEYAYGEDRSRRNPEMPVDGTRRWLVRPPVIESGQHIDTEDMFATATDPTSTFVTIHAGRIVRGKADRIMGVRKIDGAYVVADGGILGSSIEGKRPGAATALPSSQIMAHGGTGLTIDKVRAAIKQLRLNDFGLEDDDPLYAAVTPTQMDNLLAIAAQAGNTAGSGLNPFTIEEMQTGRARPLLGITWLMTNRVPLNAAGTHRLIPVWSKKNIAVGVWQDIQGDMWNDTSAKNKPYVYCSAYIDAVRIEDKGVIGIECLE
jgi:hypothetical protein